MHQRLTYMNIKFQQNRVNRSVKPVRTNIFAKNCTLHKFATKPIVFFFKSTTSLQTCTITKSLFSKILFVDQSITVHTYLLAKKSQVA